MCTAENEHLWLKTTEGFHPEVINKTKSEIHIQIIDIYCEFFVHSGFEKNVLTYPVPDNSGDK